MTYFFLFIKFFTTDFITFFLIPTNWLQVEIFYFVIILDSIPALPNRKKILMTNRSIIISVMSFINKITSFLLQINFDCEKLLPKKNGFNLETVFNNCFQSVLQRRQNSFTTADNTFLELLNGEITNWVCILLFPFSVFHWESCWSYEIWTTNYF